jgi:hypothetical protein
VKLSFLSVLAGAVLLSACASMPMQNWPQNQRPPGPEEARIIVSGGSPRPCGGRVFLVGIAKPGNFNPLQRVAEANIEGGGLRSHFTDHFGRVNVISLRPGGYILYPVAAATLQNSGTPPSYEFEVAAGELAYVGELYVDAPCGSLSGKVTMLDRQARDVAALEKLNPAFAGVPVVKRIAKPVD